MNNALLNACVLYQHPRFRTLVEYYRKCEEVAHEAAMRTGQPVERVYAEAERIKNTSLLSSYQALCKVKREGFPV